MKKILSILAILGIAILMGGCCLIPEEPEPGIAEATKDPAVIKTSSTENGVVTFIDSSTEEEVLIYVKDKNNNELSNIDVTFWDGDGYEVFILDDPSGQYLSTFEIYPHNSNHFITMHLSGDPLADSIENIEMSSEKGQAITNFVNDNEDKKTYIGRYTPEQVDELTTKKLSIIKFLGGDIFVKFASNLSDFADRIEEIFGSNDPEFFDVYILTPGGITSSIRWLEPVVENSDEGSASASNNAYVGTWYAEYFKFVFTNNTLDLYGNSGNNGEWGPVYEMAITNITGNSFTLTTVGLYATIAGDTEQTYFTKDSWYDFNYDFYISQGKSEEYALEKAAMWTEWHFEEKDGTYHVSDDKSTLSLSHIGEKGIVLYSTEQ
jgi:hypothetical protein